MFGVAGSERALLSALGAGERDTLYNLLVRAVGVQSPPCDPADDRSLCPI